MSEGREMTNDPPTSDSGAASEGQMTKEIRSQNSFWFCKVTIALGVLMSCLAGVALAEQRFPPPEFDSGHQIPTTAIPSARGLFLQYADVAMLAGCLGMATWLVFKKRSRKGVFWLGMFSLVYFGFYRKGCVCSIGSIQNVALALGSSDYAVPLGVLAFFLLPLVFALFSGRVF